MGYLKLIRKTAGAALRLFISKDPLRLAGATSFFTCFALPPILIIIIQLLGVFFKERKLRQELFSQLGGIVGKDSVGQILTVIDSFRKIAINQWIAVLGFVFLIFVATTLFKVIKNSINQLWQIRRRARPGLIKNLKERAAALMVILLSGILFLAGLLAETMRALLGRYIGRISGFLEFYFNSIAGYILIVFITSFWFAVIFRYLPDARPKWQVSLIAGLVTGILFNLGKFILHFLLVNSNIGTIYGASGSVVLLLLFVFYSSFIIYYGACFAWFWARYTRQYIKPRSGAMHYQVVLQETAVHPS